MYVFFPLKSLFFFILSFPPLKLLQDAGCVKDDGIERRLVMEVNYMLTIVLIVVSAWVACDSLVTTIASLQPN
uniref:Transmembrane protein n=1 Tax=Helianthus annuus TaxID=4232 RepID=A0A251UN12_HELAN